jgi:hypothetical protein
MGNPRASVDKKKQRRSLKTPGVEDYYPYHSIYIIFPPQYRTGSEATLISKIHWSLIRSRIRSKVKNRTQIQIKVRSWIRIRIKVMHICKPDFG